MPAEFDDLSRRLSDLESDVNNVHMAGPAAARRRGRQRTRNRAAAVVIGSATAVAIGVGALNALPLSTPSIPDPADTPTPDQDTTPDTTPTPDPEMPEVNPLADLLLSPDDLTALESHWWGNSDWTERQREADLECAPTGPDAVESAGISFQGDGFATWADEYIFVLPSEADAEAVLDELRGQLGQCATARDDVELTRTWEYDGLGDAAFQSEVIPPAETQEAARVAVIGAARTGSTLVVTTTDFYTQEAYGGEADMLTAAVAKVCGGDCVGEVTQRQTYPASAGTSDDPFLLDEEVNPVGSYTDFVRADTLEDPTRYESFCIPQLVYPEAEGQPSSEPVQAGGEAPTIYQASWFGPSEGGVYQTVMQFLDAQEAAGFMADYAELPDQCGVVIDTHEQVVNQPDPVQVSGADEALVWTIDETVLSTDPGSEGGFHGVGMARAGNVVVVIGFAAFGDPTTGTSGTWTDYATATLALALDRAGG